MHASGLLNHFVFELPLLGERERERECMRTYVQLSGISFLSPVEGQTQVIRFVPTPNYLLRHFKHDYKSHHIWSLGCFLILNTHHINQSSSVLKVWSLP